MTLAIPKKTFPFKKHLKLPEKEILWQKGRLLKISNFFSKIHYLKIDNIKEKPGIKSNRKTFIIPPNTLITRGQAGSIELGNNPEKYSLPNMDSLTQMSSKRQGEKQKENITGFYLPKLQGLPQQVRDRALWSSSAVSHTQCKLGVSVQHATVCFLQKRTPNRSSSFPFVHLCLNSKGLVKLVSKDVS